MRTRAYRFFCIKTQTAVAPRDFRFARVIIKWRVFVSTPHYRAAFERGNVLTRKIQNANSTLISYKNFEQPDSKHSFSEINGNETIGGLKLS